MSSDIAIHVTNVSKCYRIYEKPSDRLKQMIWRKKTYFKEFWALKDISIRIEKGQTYGIIGRNGSGKSTLLQCICGTLEPSSGKIEIDGKIAALLELGAGFNPEFTGRDNIYLACSLYGLNKSQTDERFKKICEFADIGDHIEQPVKTYSSGMFVRLAFAVIAHVDAEILIIDEALAVGDAVFTQKCMRFIRKFKETGTLLFVSHDMASVLNLCDQAIWLHKGTIQMMGETKEISEAYLQYTLQEAYGQETTISATTPIEKKEQSKSKSHNIKANAANYQSKISATDNQGQASGWISDSGKIVSVELLDQDGNITNTLNGGEEVTLRIEAITKQEFNAPILGFLVKDRLGQDLFGENTLPFTDHSPIHSGKDKTLTATFTFVLPMLPNGQYVIMTSLANGNLHDNVQHHYIHDAVILNVHSTKIRWGLVGVPFSRISMEAQ